MVLEKNKENGIGNKEQIDMNKRLLITGGSALAVMSKLSGLVVEAKTNEYEDDRPYPSRVVQRFEAEKRFKMFPEKVTFIKKPTVVISRKWQIGCLYNEKGEIFKKDGKNFCFQAGTGMISYKHNTPLGVYAIQSKKRADYVSGGTQDGEAVGSPMPWAMHLGRVIVNESRKLETLTSDGIALHARGTVTRSNIKPFRSHGCIGANLDIARSLNKDGLVSYGDNVVVLDDMDVLSSSKDTKELVSKLGEQEKNHNFVAEMEEYIKYRKQHPVKELCWDGSEPDALGLCPKDPNLPW
jgi:hypothetical protein